MSVRSKVSISCIAARDVRERKRSRAPHSKSRDGCLVCKASRLKCDEAHPSCVRCLKRGVSCRYRQPVHNALSILLSPAELRSFQFYRERTSRNLAGHFDQDFWTNVVIKLSYTNDTLQHFLVALGSLDESFSLRAKTLGQRHHATSLYAFSLQQYNVGINSILRDSQLHSMPAFMLASCITSVLYELWLGSHENARKHARAASRLQLQLEPTVSTNGDDEEKAILDRYLAPIIARNSRQFSTCSDTLPSRACLHEMKSLPTSVSLSGPFDDAKVEFENLALSLIEQAQTAVEHLQGFDLTVKLQKLLFQLDQWHESFLSLPPLDCPNSIRELNRLKVKYHVHRIAISCAPYEDECAYDRHTADFRAIVDLCAEFLTSSTKGRPHQVIRAHDSSTSMALSVVGSQCRDPEVRKEAIRLLYRYPRLEGVWFSPMQAFFAEMAAMSEERGLPQVKTAADIAPEQRVRMRTIIYNPGCLAEDSE